MLLSNNKEPREMFNDAVQVSYIYKAGKRIRRITEKRWNRWERMRKTLLFVEIRFSRMSIGANRTGNPHDSGKADPSGRRRSRLLKALSGKRSSCFSIGENAKAAERSAEAIKKQFGRRKQWRCDNEKDGAKTRMEEK